jgi:hypothetical protein
MPVLAHPTMNRPQAAASRERLRMVNSFYQVAVITQRGIALA